MGLHLRAAGTGRCLRGVGSGGCCGGASTGRALWAGVSGGVNFPMDNSGLEGAVDS